MIQFDEDICLNGLGKNLLGISNPNGPRFGPDLQKGPGPTVRLASRPEVGHHRAATRHAIVGSGSGFHEKFQLGTSGGCCSTFDGE